MDNSETSRGFAEVAEKVEYDLRREIQRMQEKIRPPFLDPVDLTMLAPVSKNCRKACLDIEESVFQDVEETPCDIGGIPR